MQPLRAHPAVLACVPKLGSGETQYRLDHPARLLPAAQHGTWLNSDAVEDVRRLGYEIVPRGNPAGSDPTAEGLLATRRAHVRGIRVLWALDDTDALGIVEASHKSALPPPSPEVAAQMGALTPLPLRAGDLVLAAATTLLAWRHASEDAAAPPRVLELVLCFDSKLEQEGPAAPAMGGSLEHFLTNDQWVFQDDRYLINPEYYLANDGIEPPPAEMPPWFFELSPEQQAVCGGHAGMAAVSSDGSDAHIKAPTRVALATTQEEAERWFWDTNGCKFMPAALLTVVYLPPTTVRRGADFIIPDVMDANWLGSVPAFRCTSCTRVVNACE